ncbi:hypothetical protein SDC9_133538 [bioreactor metagenome]|uniref:Uncharacterized protein n=1 Tax=bioreactor metagenome TaxID=1076179 RepID=A0A645DB64_9ZZZZ
MPINSKFGQEVMFPLKNVGYRGCFKGYRIFKQLKENYYIVDGVEFEFPTMQCCKAYIRGIIKRGCL